VTVKGTYIRFVGLALVTAAAICGFGYYPTLLIAGSAGLVAMFVGCAVSFIAACGGAVPIALAMSRRPKDVSMAILSATGVRFLVVLAMVAPLALSNRFETTAMVLWTGISYMLMLVVDTMFALRMMRRLVQGEES